MAFGMLSVPLTQEVKTEMDKHSDIKWVEVARKAIIEKLQLLEKMDELLAKSEFTQEDALRHGRIVNKRVLARHQG